MTGIEDVRGLLIEMSAHAMVKGWHGAIDRVLPALAALEQHVSDLEKSLEQARREVADVHASCASEAEKELVEWQQAMGTNVPEEAKAALEQARKERDEAMLVLDRVRGSLADAGVPVSVSPQEWLRVSWLATERRKAEQTRDAALADNAARARIGAQMANACFNLVQRKEMTAEDVLALDRLRQEWDALGSYPGAALLEEHKRALVRARNEGLEKAAAMFDGFAAEAVAAAARVSDDRRAGFWMARDKMQQYARKIRDLKEPEP